MRMDKRSLMAANLVVLSVLVLSLRGYGESSEQRWQSKIPVLTVTGDGHANVIPVNLRYSRNPKSRDPLEIAISEQFPMASGDTLRASIWQSAMVAAFERNDPMTGVTIQIHVPGRGIDGPSAGCAFTLGILSAMDGRTYPTNVAVTGSILPDGTVGQVGGVNLKVSAARRAGLNTIIVPDFLRMEYVPVGESSIMVDIKRLAESAGMRYVPVANIADAYAHLHRLKLPAVNAGKAIELPPALDVYYFGEYENYRTKSVQKLLEVAELKKDDKDATESVELIASLIAGSLAQAEQAALMGYFDVAAEHARYAYNYGVARLGADALFENEKVFETLNAEIDKRIAIANDPLGLAVQLRRGGLSAGGVEFLGNAATGVALVNYIGVWAVEQSDLHDRIKAAEQSQGDEVSSEDIERAWGDYFADEYNRLVLAGYIQSWNTEYPTNILSADLANAYPSGYRYSADNGAANLLYAAHSASTRTFLNNLQSNAQQMGIDGNEWFRNIFLQDPQSSVGLGGHIDEIRQLLDSGKYKGPDAEYLETVSALFCVASMTESARLMLCSFELNPEYDENGLFLRYQRTGLLHHLLRNARAQALQAIQSCRDKGYPWLAAATAFRKADLERDEASVDKTNVLAGYWYASLLSKSLMMLLVPEGEAQPARASVHAGIRVKELLPVLQPTLSGLLQAGDVITHIDNHRVCDYNELRAAILSVPKGEEYEVKYVRPATREKASATATGGSFLGVNVEPFTIPPRGLPR